MGRYEIVRRDRGGTTGVLVFPAVFFGLCAVAFICMLVRPQRLLLDDEGFAIVGGLVRSPKKVYWRDVGEFFVYRLPFGPKAIGFNYKPGATRLPSLIKLNRRFGADAAFPTIWTVSPERMVEDLNAHRLRATNRQLFGMPRNPSFSSGPAPGA